VRTAIHTVYWDLLKPEVGSGQWARAQDILAIWPAPVNPDACFSAAGFDEFADQDEQWEDEWRSLIGRLLACLERFGAARVCRSAEVYEVLPTLQRWMNFLRGRPTRKRVELTIAEQIELVTQDDQFDNVLLVFGSGPYARLSAGGGHEILFVQVAEQTDSSAEDLLRQVADARPVVRKVLDWSCLT